MMSSLYHLRARQYDPSTGRFGALDPVDAPLTDPYTGEYVYVNDQPLVAVDPTGERLEFNAGGGGSRAATRAVRRAARSTAAGMRGIRRFVPQYRVSRSYPSSRRYLPRSPAVVLPQRGACPPLCRRRQGDTWLGGKIKAIGKGALMVARIPPVKAVQAGRLALKAKSLVRNPFGRRGSPPHVDRIAQAETRLNNMGWGTVAGGSRPERKFGGRFPDLVVGRGDQRVAVQVGRTTKRSPIRPVWRERAPLADLRNSGSFDHVFFIGYKPKP